ncbi:LAFE_0F10748g1_1 [Lachancea fermentati]|uniref:N-acetyltransferase ECO1 n=1 Tax=Lachancea fermentati TaxID=4955 RepID=A0A1G4MFC4_LACFM|nr:LAFE_0F10748g1_1 [Lachancea fermentati]
MPRLKNTSSKNRKASKSKKLVQSVLRIGKQPESLIRCPECSLTYSLDAARDVATHENYHDLHLRGRKWPSQWGQVVAHFPSMLQSSTPSSIINVSASRLRSGAQRSSSDILGTEQIIVICPENKHEVRATLEILKIVNDELRAPHDENSFWSGISGPGRIENECRKAPNGKAFVYVKNSRAVGVITAEYLDVGDKRGRWMVLDTSQIVSQVSPDVRLGISRIWVCRKQRGLGIATRLLEAARLHSILGTELAKWQMAWSQPSESGAKLAKTYNSVLHQKSGKLIIPCYI